MELSTQIRTFLLIVTTGIVLGILFDTYRVLRRRFRPPWLVTSLTDLLYCLLASAIAFTALLAGNWGELRFYVYIALLVGIIAYYRLVSQYVMKFIMALLLLITKLCHLTKLAVAFTIIKPVVFVTRTALWPFRFIGRKYSAWYKRRRPPPPEEIPPL
ncbi:spore cortex biosynthesis protein YabQ [Sporomusa sphaeroides]|uniref:Spore protein YabQ n=2 Tax=Sporomusa TaxID=2375 RepID=A0ABP2C512_9FIRM|nr:spore cortex biosynthesis protein YabQ [Sporomusa sphaeroides]OLS56849.1 spore protein YabQ [Sporomusa sphaeroides DSM 2875]CVK18796.1 Spore protein YabQ [Sporomusa sphaeroides DSM 2875]SCM81882.1 Spore cortex biosynthesis protein [uncultured Sporomusa sp.]